MVSPTAVNRKPAPTREVPLFVPGQNKPVAGVTGNVLHKYIRGSVHLRHNPPAIGWDAEVLRQAEALGAASIRVKDIETSTTYTAPLDWFRAHAFPQNQGHGAQYFLRLEWWEINGAPCQMVAWEAERAAKAARDAARPVQLGIFGGAA